MSETTFEYDEIIPVPIEAAWAAMLRTSELDVLAGQPVVERASNADFVCEMALENGLAHALHRRIRRVDARGYRNARFR